MHSELFENDLVQNVQHISVRGVKGVQRQTVEEVNFFFNYFFVALRQNVIWVGSELIGQSGCILILFKGRRLIIKEPNVNSVFSSEHLELVKGFFDHL